MATQRKSSVTPKTEPERKAEALAQYNDTEGHFSLVRNFRLADLVTIMNGFCGSFSIFSSARYLISHDESELYAALAFPLAGLMFDFFDGKVARWRQSSSLLGQELDSLADLRSQSASVRSLDQVVLTVFICCGLARLARFNATVASVPKDRTGKSKYFEGLPIPSSLTLVGLMTYWVRQGWTGLPGGQGLPLGVIQLWGKPGGSGEVHTAAIVFGCWAAAMVSKTLHVPKP
ncbi:phosphatidylserine synthase [Rhizoctonia solani AG-1 IB]|uniref:Phosphatidylserine synthase n=1 Tax=Thanatephorus cucumeris (strain AG1-IB / isolate 7/3/14) TaxID=1108050 RepID=A0A0B7F4E1_THACB|nr:phosphatidylserine synthase [Rhizoctonia solani AG-1 IB]